MSEAGKEVPLPETLRSIAKMNSSCDHLCTAKSEDPPTREEVQQNTLPSVSELLELVHAIRRRYLGLVRGLTEASEATTSADPTSMILGHIESLAQPIAELQKGIRSKNAQCVRLELRSHIANEVEARRRALSRMETALSIAKQCL